MTMPSGRNCSCDDFREALLRWEVWTCRFFSSSRFNLDPTSIRPWGLSRFSCLLLNLNKNRAVSSLALSELDRAVHSRRRGGYKKLTRAGQYTRQYAGQYSVLQDRTGSYSPGQYSHLRHISRTNYHVSRITYLLSPVVSTYSVLSVYRPHIRRPATWKGVRASNPQRLEKQTLAAGLAGLTKTQAMTAAY